LLNLLFVYMYLSLDHYLVILFFNSNQPFTALGTPFNPDNLRFVA